MHALGDGEDFELILAVPPEEARRMLAEQPLARAAERYRRVRRRAGPLDSKNAAATPAAYAARMGHTSRRIP